MRQYIALITQLACRIGLYLYPSQLTWGGHIKALFFTAVIAFFLGAGLLLSWVDVGQVYALKDYKPPTPSKLIDRKGRLISKFFQDHRILVEKKEVPPVLVKAFIATEDNHFFSHHGIDLQAILRAFLINLQAGGVKQGGSTITQQLAKVMMTGQRRTYIRKAKEAVLALFLDALYEKKDIMNMYLNQIYFGHGNYGVGAASRFYFDKQVKELTAGEAAVLAGLPSAPNRYSPVRNPRISMTRLSHVLMKMVDMGFLTRQQAAKEYAEMVDYFGSLNVSPSATAFGNRIDHAPYFTETIRRRLEKEIGKKKLYTGGLTIHTSLDLDHQKEAQSALWQGLRRQSRVSHQYAFRKHLNLSRRHAADIGLIQLLFDLPDLENQKSLSQYEIEVTFQRNLADKVELLNLAMGGDHNLNRTLMGFQKHGPDLDRYQPVQGALVEIDQKTGYVTAMVGGLPFSSTNQINRAEQMKRQPGSTFKPLLYAAAIDTGKVNAATVFPDSPMIFLSTSGESWTPENYSGGYRGFITMREALRYSVNLVSIAIAREVSLGSVLPTIAKQLDVKTKDIPPNLTVALGTYEVSPLQMARAFAVFPRGGKKLEERMIIKIIDSDGNILRDNSTKKQPDTQILKQGTAAIMTSLLKNVVARGTGTGVRSSGYRGFAAGKTGTTNNWRDAWFVGFTNRYTTALWMGYDRSSMSLGPHQSGGVVASKVWGNYQARVAKYLQDEESYLIETGFTTAAVCPDTGTLAKNGCCDAITELFLPGHLPQESCGAEPAVTLPDDLTGEQNNKPTVTTEEFFGGDEDL